MRFEEFDLEYEVLDGLEAMRFDEATPVQEATIPLLLEGRDMIACAQTGTGKTAAYLLPILNRLCRGELPEDKVNAVIMAPTRELAVQIEQQIDGFSYFLPVSSTAIYGGTDGITFAQQQRGLTKGVDIVIATPGRLISMLNLQQADLGSVSYFVLDEADRMLDMGFIPDIKRIVRHLPANTHRQSLLFSATFNTDVMNLAYRWLFNPVFVEIAKAQKTNADIEQRFYLLSEDKKMQALKQLLRDNSVDKCIIFANRKDQVKRLHDHLAKRYEVVMLSGDVVQQKREKHLQKFKTGEVKLLVATDVAGRGIHVDDVTHVINFTLPDMPDDYVHRIGRTGRAGQTGISVSFVSEDDAFNLPALEKHLNTRFELHQFEFEDIKKPSSKSSADNQPSQHNSSDEPIE